MAIDRTRSRLMTEDHIRAFDALEAQFSRIEQGLHQLWSLKEMQVLRERLENLKNQMERPRYYVGFLGRSQVGKSTTLNSLLKAQPGQGPGTSGPGAPTTSNVTRLYRIDPGDGEGHRVTLQYMTSEQFHLRRAGLCSYLGLRPEDPDDVILAHLDETLRREQQAADGEARPVSARTEDCRYLARLLRSFQKYPGLVTDPPRTEAGDYDQRATYTNHPKKDEAFPYVLLQQVEIGYQTDQISTKIELIDLPGLGGRLFSDDLLTETFLKQLDGALVFQSSEQVAAKEAYVLLEKLSKRFQRMDGRVWMVFTRFDGLALAHQGATADAENILDKIAQTLSDNRVPHEQVLMVGNEFHRQLIEADNQAPQQVANLWKLVLKLGLDGQGQPIIPEGFLRHPMLVEAFREVIRDGGIENIRKVIGDRLADLVEQEVRQAVDAELRSLRSDLRRMVRSAEEASRMNAGAFRKSVMWKIALQGAVQELYEDRSIIESPSNEAIKKLQEEFRMGLFPEKKLTIKRAKLRDAHKDYAEVLNESASLEYRTELVPKIYGWVSEALRASHKNLGDLRINGHASPLIAWEELKGKDLEDSAWLEKVLRFDEPKLFPAEEEQILLTDRQYRDIIPKKVETLCHRAALAILERIKGHLGDLEESLALMKMSENRVDTGRAALFDDLLKALS
jgi:hypothetical protein